MVQLTLKKRNRISKEDNKPWKLICIISNMHRIDTTFHVVWCYLHSLHTGTYDSEISDDDSEHNGDRDDSSSSTEGEDSDALERRRRDFSRRQRDRLKQVELEEKQAMGKWRWQQDQVLW